MEAWGRGPSSYRKIAVVDDLMLARAAFDAAVAESPTAWITLRQGVRVICENKPSPSYRKRMLIKSGPKAVAPDPNR